MISYAVFAKGYTRFIIRHAGRILLGLLLFTALLSPLALKLKLKANLIDLLPEDMPSVVNLHNLTEEVGGTSYLIAVIESPDEKTAKEAAADFTAVMKSLPGVDEVDNRTGVKAFQDRKLLFLSLKGIDQIKAHVDQLIGYHRRKNNPFYIDLLDEKAPELDTSTLELDEKIYKVGGLAGKEAGHYMRVVLIKPKHEVSTFPETEAMENQARAAFQDFQAKAAHPVSLGFTGPYKTRYDEFQVIRSDLGRTGLLTFLMIVVLMGLFFRNLRSMLMAFVSLGMGLVWTAAFAQATISYLNLITAFLLAILFGLGISFAIHILTRYEEEKARMGDTAQALERTIEDLTQPLLTSALTTSIAFLSLTISRFYGFKHFGWIAGVGILLCLLSIYLALPCLMVLQEKLPKLKTRMVALSRLSGRPRPGPIYVILILGFLWSVYSAFSIGNQKFEYNFAELQHKGAESIKFADRIGDHFGVVLNPVGLVTPSREASLALSDRVNEYIQAHPESTFDFAASILMHVPKNQEIKMQRLMEIEAVFAAQEDLIGKLKGEPREKIDELRHQLNTTPFRFEDLPAGVIKQYEGTAGRVSVTYIYPKSSLLNGQTAKRFVRELRAMDLPEEVIIAGEPVIYADILMLLERDTVWAMVISLAVVVLLLFLHFKRPRDVLWVLLPVVTAFLWLLGICTLAGFKFNYLNVTILPSILGVGIDSGVHIFHRYKKEGHATFFSIMKKTGLAVILSLLTTMAAFLSLYLAKHQGMSSLGQLGVMGFGACLMTSVFFIPGMIEFIELEYWRTASKRTHKEIKVV